LAVLLTAAVFIYLEIFISDITGKAPDESGGTMVTVTGMVQSKEFRKSFEGEILPVIYLIPSDKNIKKFCLIQCYLDSSDTLPEIGTIACVSGKVKIFSPPTNPGEFDSRLYYSSLKILYRINSCKVLKTAGKANRYREILFKVRMFFERGLDTCLCSEDAAIMKAMLLGDKAYMDAEIKDMYKDSGIIHILAVSGLHISIIGMAVYRLINKLFDLMLLEGDLPFTSRFRKKPRCIRTDELLTFLESGCIGKMLATAIAVFVMYSYGVMCGMGTSSFRAICMFALRIIAPVVGRTYDILSALALSGLLLLLDQPLYLYNSGFLFSFGAVLGITVVKPLLVPVTVLTGDFDEKMKFVEEKPEERGGILAGFGSFANLNNCKVFSQKILDGLINSLAVVITTLPVYACFYYTYPLHSLLLNLIVIPVMGVLMLFGIGSMLVSGAGMWNVPFISATGILNPLGKVSGFAVHVILAFYRWLCSGYSIRRKFTWYMGHAEKWQVMMYVLFVTLFVIVSLILQSKVKLIYKIVLSGKQMNYDKRFFNGLMDCLRGLLLVLAVFVLTFHIDPEFAIDMIDVGQGDGIVISCGDKHMLIDGGSTSKKNVGKYQIIPFLKYNGVGELDAVVMTHEDEDHISGILEVMDDMEKGGILIKQLILPEVSEKSQGDNYHKLEKKALEFEIPVSYINTGESFKLGEASFLCLNPQKNMVTEGANAYSTVLYMKYGNFTALFTGDMEEEGLQNVKEVLKAADFNNITLLKVAHHGSKYTNDEEFLNLLKPRISLISCGRDNRYGHPHEEVLERLDDIHSKIYRTDEGGEIRVLVEKGKVHVSQWGRFRLTH